MALNKNWKKVIAISLALTFVVGVSGCEMTATKPADPSQATEVPDYSDSTKRMNMYAYVGPTPGTYTNAAGQSIFAEDFRTIERYQEYKDCGFDTLLLLGNDGYSGQEFSTSSLKKNLDMAQEVGLQVLVFDQRIHDLSCKSESNIGEGKEFASMDELVKTLKEYMKPYMDHPAFRGLSLKDEPIYEHFDSMAEVQEALRLIDQDIFGHTVVLPYLDNVSLKQYTGKSFGNVTIDSYRTYVNTFLEKTKLSYLSYDNYPFYEDGLLSTYYRNLQVAVEEADKYDAEVWLAIQSAAWATIRPVEEDDLRYQCNSALAFGVKNIQYYTYWQFPDGSHSQAVIAHDGTKMLYDEAKRVNEETHKMAKVMLNFDFEKAAYTYDKENAISAPTLFSGLKSAQLDGAEFVSVTGATMMSQMKDVQKGLTGYMIVNAADPIDNPEDKVSVKFDGYDYATLYVKGEPETVGLTDSVLTLTLGSGEGVFVIPHK